MAQILSELTYVKDSKTGEYLPIIKPENTITDVLAFLYQELGADEEAMEELLYLVKTLPFNLIEQRITVQQ